MKNRYSRGWPVVVTALCLVASLCLIRTASARTEVKLTASDAAAGDQFEASVSLDGERADDAGFASGLAFKTIADNLSGAISSDKASVVVGTEEPPVVGGFDYAIIHYNRPLGDYGDHTTGDFNDFWGLHLWGDAIDPSEGTDWPDPKPFLGEDEFGRFAWIRRGGSDSQVNFIIHRGDTKDTPADRFFDADVNPEIWVNQDDATLYTSQADAQGFVTVRYHRDDGDYGDITSPDFNDFWGLHLWGGAIDPSEGTVWTEPKPPTGIDDYGAFWEIQIVDSSQPVNFIIHRGDNKDPGPDESFIPADVPTVWKQSGDETIYPSRGAAEDYATIHYHRDDGDYGDNASPDFNDFWGLHVWDGALTPNPAWQDPVRWDRLDVFGPVFEVDVIDGAPLLAYIIHRGDDKDPGPDQFLVFDEWGYEVWQLSGEHPSDPARPHYVLPILGEGAASDTDGDGVPDSDDLCAGTSPGASVDADGCSDAQVDGDGDGVCDPGAPSSGPSGCTGSDNCPLDANPGQEDLDGDGDGDACDATVNVIGAIEVLLAKVEALGLPDGLGNALLSKLNNAGKSWNKGNANATTGQLGAFINQVEARRGKDLTDAEADHLIACAQAIIDGINGGTAAKGGDDEHAPEVQADVPTEVVLEAAYPNPFNPQTTIRFGLPETAPVRLVVYDVLGRQVRVLLDGPRAAGTHEVVFEAGDLPSGTYLVRLATPAGSFVQTMQLVK